MLVNDASRDRPIYQDIQRLSDAQLTTLCNSHGLVLGPLDSQNRRMAERQLHIAMITERAKYRARQQFALECHMRGTAYMQQGPPPPQNHYQPMPPQTYWPSPGSNLRSPPPPSWNTQNRRVLRDPVLQPRQYTTWRQEHRMSDQRTADSGNNFLGFRMPFSLGAARDIRSRITNSIKRFQGGGAQNGPVHKKEEQVTPRCQNAEYQEDYREDSDDDSVEKPSSSDYERDTLSGASEGEGQEVERQELSAQNFYPYPFNDRQLQGQFDGQEAQNELRDYKSFISLSSVYHDFDSQVPMARTAPSVDSKPRFSWWWQWRARAGDERIPEAERTTEQNLLQERELKTINYLSEAPARLDDGVVELMGRVELRDDSEEEVLLEGTQRAPGSRSWMGFCRHIFHLLCCDRQGKLDPEKLRCSFFCCCMAAGVYMSFKMLRY
ncbi:uncharacterized protein LOC6542754 [Drosophila erecta]|uniref:LEM domain-containing protein n=1 Tax=Drosophila erecta TaxID=7220 RepID=B3N7Y8_DROER|nr:uncharacterized protein LOC6542754 [Drosophila erecta]EDV58349.2 uncharacterized protein Dere_GG25342 [Drosophila erecta]